MPRILLVGFLVAFALLNLYFYCRCNILWITVCFFAPFSFVPFVLPTNELCDRYCVANA